MNSNIEEKKVAIIADGGKVDSSDSNDNEKENENGGRNGVTADTTTQCNEDTTPTPFSTLTPTPTTELHESQDLELNLESKRDLLPDRFDDECECEYDFNVEMYTPSILLLVDEIAALEKDILKRHTDAAAAVAATQVLTLLLLRLLLLLLLLLLPTLTPTLTLVIILLLFLLL